jgi:hypothetical protein
MTTETLARPTTPEMHPSAEQVILDPIELQQKQTLGFDNEALIGLSRKAIDSTLFPKSISDKLELVPEVLLLAPLLEKIQPAAVAEVPKETIRKAVTGFIAEKLKAAATTAVVETVNHKLDKPTSESGTEEVQGAKEAVRKIKEAAEVIASEENPREKFVREVTVLSEQVHDAIRQQRDLRAKGMKTPEPQLEGVKGFKGLVVKVVQKVKGFFRRLFGGGKAKQLEVTAYDAGAGIEKTLNTLRKDPDTPKRFPVLSKLMLDHLPAEEPAHKVYYAIMAPEILNALSSASKEKEAEANLIHSVERNQHDLRFAMKYKDRWGRFSIKAIQEASTSLLPALRDALPTDGLKLNAILQYLQMLNLDKEVADASTEESTTDEKTSVALGAKPKRAKAMLKRLNERFRS